MELFKVKDLNGKEFSFSLEQLQDMDSGIFTNEPHVISDNDKMEKFQVEICDEEGNIVDLANITDEEVKDIKALDVTYEATHSGDNRNYSIYHSDSMEKDAQSWMSPFKKPFLKNHDIESEPMGRVKDFYFGQSEFCQDRDTINVTWRITDKEAIPKFLDGRYHTMSIGARCGHIKCNICGKDILKDGKVKFCGHWKGETYGTQKALWHARDLEYREGSVVNSPADDWAQVKKIVIVREGDNKNNDSKNEDSSILDDMDNIINDSENNDSQIPNQNDNSNEGENPNDNTNPNENQDDENPKLTEKYNTYDFSNIDSLVSLVGVLDANIEETNNFLKNAQDSHEKEVEKLTGDMEDFKSKNEALTKDNEKLVQDKKDLEAEISVHQDKFLKLAKLNKNLLADKIVECENLNNSIEDKKARKEELLKLTSKELNDMYNELDVNDIVQRKIATVSNPGLANNDSHTILDGEEGTIVENKVTLEDIEESVINNIIR